MNAKHRDLREDSRFLFNGRRIICNNDLMTWSSCSLCGTVFDLKGKRKGEGKTVFSKKTEQTNYMVIRVGVFEF